MLAILSQPQYVNSHSVVRAIGSYLLMVPDGAAEGPFCGTDNDHCPVLHADKGIRAD